MTRSSPSFSPLPRFSGRRRAKITLTLDSDIAASIIHLRLHCVIVLKSVQYMRRKHNIQTPRSCLLSLSNMFKRFHFP